MKKNPYTSAVIVAAGSATRMEGMQKIMLPINKKPLIVYTLMAFEESNTVDEIIVITRKELIDEIKQECIKNKINKLTKIAEGGETRQESVYKGFRLTDSKSKFICIHDGARPLITANEIDTVNNSAYEYSAVCSGTKVINTIKVTDDNGYIVDTPNRSCLFSASTPQVFSTEIYQKAHDFCINNHKNFTDDAGMAEAAGFMVKAVECSYKNIKVTTPEDIFFVRANLKNTEQ